MSKLIPILCGVFLFCGLDSRAASDDWKGGRDSSQLHVSALTGLGVIDSSAGFTLIGGLSKKIIEHGFLPDIADSVSMEGQLGPVFVSGGPAWFYSAHLRWDFQKDSAWTLYALGGVAGNVWTISNATRIEFFPRFGIGAIWELTPIVRFRAEISHELLGVGVVFPF